MTKKILLVEDSHGLAHMVTKVLLHGNYSVKHATNGSEALKEIEQNEFDLVILDLMMPIMDGKEFLLILRGELKNTTPVMVYTGSQDIDIIEELIEAGANKVMFKPLGVSKLLELVKELIK